MSKYQTCAHSAPRQPPIPLDDEEKGYPVGRFCKHACRSMAVIRDPAVCESCTQYTDPSKLMAEVNFNSIYDGVSLALHAAFPAAQVHGGNVKQGLKPGDFNVIMPGAGHAKEVGQRYKRTPTVDVIYYPKAGDAECYGMAHRLSFVLGSITTPEGDIIHATGCEWTLAEDVLHVLLSYDHFVRVPLEQENMETLKINEEG